MTEAPRRSRLPEAECPETWVRIKEIYMVTHWQDFFGKDHLCWSTLDGRESTLLGVSARTKRTRIMGSSATQMASDVVTLTRTCVSHRLIPITFSTTTEKLSQNALNKPVLGA